MTETKLPVDKLPEVKLPEDKLAEDDTTKEVAQPLKRRNSRFLLEETKDKKSEDKESVMYRPEFGEKDD
jgi:hypothetical protein